MTVPYDRLSQALQSIHRRNGKVESVTMTPASVPAVATPAVAAPAVAAPAVAAPAPTRAAELPPEQKSRSSKPKRKQRR
jgi:hypothetical protein